MCHFITATLSDDSDLDALLPILERHRLSLERIDAPPLRAQLRDGESCFRFGAGCACRSPLGSGGRARLPHGQRRDADRARTGHVSLTDPDIRRWLEGQARTPEVDDPEPVEEPVSLEEWQSFLVEALASGATRQIGLLIHWCDGDARTAPVRVRRRQVVPIGSLSAEVLHRLEEDVLYYVIPTLDVDRGARSGASSSELR